MKFPHALPALLIVLASCQGNTTEKKAPSSVVVENPEAPTEWAGSYADTLPCSDCPGIFIQLMLREDSTFILRSRYLERDSIPYGEIGQWSTDGAKLLLNGKAEWMEMKGALKKLNASGGVLDSDLPFTIRPVPNIEPSPMHLTGAYVYYADSHSFKPCGSAYRLPVAMDERGGASAGLKLEKRYTKGVKSPPDPLYVRITATLRTGPAMEGDGNEEYVHVEQLDRVLERQECP